MINFGLNFNLTVFSTFPLYALRMGLVLSLTKNYKTFADFQIYINNDWRLQNLRIKHFLSVLEWSLLTFFQKCKNPLNNNFTFDISTPRKIKVDHVFPILKLFSILIFIEINPVSSFINAHLNSDNNTLNGRFFLTLYMRKNTRLTVEMCVSVGSN